MTRQSTCAQRSFALLLAGLSLVIVPTGLQAQANPNGLKVHRSPQTGHATFVTGAGAKTIPMKRQRGAQPSADDFLAEHGELFGVKDATQQLLPLTSRVDSLTHTHTSYKQMHHGVPVFAGVLRVHQNAGGAFVAANGHFFPIPEDLSTRPAIDAAKARRVAEDALARGPVGLELSELVVVDPGWYGDPPIGPHLAYHIILNDTLQAIREGFFIDAQTGAVLDEWNMIHGSRNREIHNAAGTSSLPGPVTRTEGQGPVADADTNRGYDYSGDTYDYYFRAFGRDSLNNLGLKLIVTVNSTAPMCPNAFWNGTQMVFCAGMVTDDVMAHELTHGITQYTANLIYQNQSGQLNESYSDIVGELVDLFNGNAAFVGTPGGPPFWPATLTGSGTDTPNTLRTACSPNPSHVNGVRWLCGEDATGAGGAIRDMWSPTCFNHPDRANSPLETCNPLDNGGVHSGSGVMNHAFAIAVDGKTFNGQTVTGIGPIKAGAIWYRALTVYLTPSSDFSDAYTALNQAATDLIGTTPNDPRTGVASTSAITASDAQQVDKALLATEMNTNGACGGNVPPTLAVTSPNGGESWVQASVHSITWTTGGAGSTVTIDLLQSGSPVLNIATNVTNNGTFSWTIPAGQPPANSYRVRITSGAVSDTSNADFSIISNSCTSTLETTDFESGLGLLTIDNAFGTGSGLWHVSTNCDVTLPNHSATHALYYGVDASCTYNAGNTEGVATSSAISLASVIAPILLNFKYRLQTESAPASYDMATVELSVNGGAFTTIASNNSTLGVAVLSDPSGIWQSASINLSAYAGSSIQIRFHFRTVDGTSNSFPGFYVDDIQLCGNSICIPPAAPSACQATPADVCPGQSTVLSATPGSGGDTVEWFTGSCGTTPVPGGASPSVSPTVTTTYYARTKSTLTNCSSSTCCQVTVAVNLPPVAPSGPTPASGAISVPVNQTLAWNASACPGNGSPVTIHFDELPSGTLVNGAVIGIAHFSFSSVDATIGFVGPGATTYIHPPNIEGTRTGTLTVDFSSPVFSVSYGFALSTSTAFNNATTMAIYNSSLTLIGTASANSTRLITFAEGTNIASSSQGIARVIITFSDPSAARFVVDDLAFVPCSTSLNAGLAPAVSGAMAPDPAHPGGVSPQNDWQMIDGISRVEDAVISATAIEGSEHGVSLEPRMLSAELAQAACPITYDVYLGTTNPPTAIVCADVTTATCNPGLLIGGTTYYWKVVSKNCCGNVPGPVWSFTTAGSPYVAEWRSYRQHVGGELSIMLNPSATGNGIAGPTTETRQGGIQTIRLTLSQPATIVNSSAISVIGRTTSGGAMGSPIAYIPASVSMVGSSTLQLSFAPGVLPGESCYTIAFGPGATSLVLAGDLDVNVRVLSGDTTQNGVVTLSDAALVKARASSSASTHPQLDIDLSGTIDPGDAGQAKTGVLSPPAPGAVPITGLRTGSFSVRPGGDAIGSGPVVGFRIPL